MYSFVLPQGCDCHNISDSCDFFRYSDIVCILQYGSLSLDGYRSKKLLQVWNDGFQRRISWYADYPGYIWLHGTLVCFHFPDTAAYLHVELRPESVCRKRWWKCMEESDDASMHHCGIHRYRFDDCRKLWICHPIIS